MEPPHRPPSKLQQATDCQFKQTPQTYVKCQVMLQKVLKQSDIGSLGRIVLPKVSIFDRKKYQMRFTNDTSAEAHTLSGTFPNSDQVHIFGCQFTFQRIKARNPDISHREAFNAAAKNVMCLLPHVFIQGRDVGEMIGASIDKVKAVAFIRSYKSKHNQQATTRFVIVNAYKVQKQMESPENKENSKVIENLSLKKSPSPKLKPKRSNQIPIHPTNQDVHQVVHNEQLNG
ncbi:hypothetical protein LXL04_008368 [Taraxacum kok-saghyz]